MNAPVAPVRSRFSTRAIWGFAPLLVGLVLAVLLVLFAPSVAPEVVVVRPGEPISATSTSTSTTTLASTTSTSAVEVAP